VANRGGKSPRGRRHPWIGGVRCRITLRSAPWPLRHGAPCSPRAGLAGDDDRLPCRNPRPILARTSPIQRPKGAKGWTVIEMPSTRPVIQLPSPSPGRRECAASAGSPCGSPERHPVEGVSSRRVEGAAPGRRASSRRRFQGAGVQSRSGKSPRVAGDGRSLRRQEVDAWQEERDGT